MQSSDDSKTVLAIFMYNCEKQIGRVLTEIDPSLAKRFKKIIVLDNQSQDSSFEVAQKAVRDLKIQNAEVIRNPKNLGLGGSHKEAFKYALNCGAEYLAVLHGDHQASAQELHFLLDEAQRNPKAAAILGSRFMANSKRRGYSLIRTLGNFGLNGIYTLLAGRVTKDLGSGINVFRVLPLDRIAKYSNGFTFNMDLLLDYYAHQDPVVFFPITWMEEDQVSNARTFKVGWTALKTVVKWRLKLH